MDDKSNRIDARLPCSLAVIVQAGRNQHRARTEDVGERGVFVRTDTPPRLRQLLRLEIALPGDPAPLSVHGMAVHVIEPGGSSARIPGVGVQFYALNGDVAGRWGAFFGRLKSELGAQAAARSALVEGEPVRRRHPRTSVELELELASVDQLLTLYTRDVSAGGMFIVTDLELSLGARLRVEVHHPADGSTFSLEARVRRVAVPPEPRGLGVEFVDMDEQGRRGFLAFITVALPPESIRLIAPGDPALAG